MTNTIEVLKAARELISDPTPGPWTVKRLSRKMTITGNIHQVVSEGDFPTAFVPAWDAPQKGEEDGTAEAIANAYLISAAPDLLAALKAIKRHGQLACVAVDNGPFGGGKKPATKDVFQFQRHMLTQIDEAIAKAEGGAA